MVKPMDTAAIRSSIASTTTPAAGPIQIQPCGEGCRYYQEPFDGPSALYGRCLRPGSSVFGAPLLPGRDCPHYQPNTG